MRHLLQDMTSGVSSIIESPSYVVSSNTLLVSTTTSLISAGTERMLVNFSKASYLNKARQQPEKVKMVLEKIKTDGLFSTVSAVRSKLNQPLSLGYCNVGVVTGIGKGVQGFKLGDRVVSNGSHGDVVKVSKNLCVRIPSTVDDETAVFTVLASIGLQGIRLAAPTLGESIVVIGAGLIGLLTIQLLKAQGCRVLAVDFDENKLHLAKQFGAEICNAGSGQDPVVSGVSFSRGRGVDAVIITAATKSDEPVTQAAQMSRKRGRIILVGVTGLTLNRADFYEKELTFQVSCSYGPGRYDSDYEEKGFDYPIGFVRWTEQRNFEAVLDLMTSGHLNVTPLITHRFLFEEAECAYETLMEDKKALGILLAYASNPSSRDTTEVFLQEKIHFDPQRPILGFIGAGNYASRVLIPAFKKAKAQFHTLVTSSGLNAVIHGKQAGFIKAASALDAVLVNSEINTVAIVTRHDSHAQMVIKAFVAGKHVFVEKPLAITLEELAAVEAAYYTAHASGKKVLLMVGFNRRFSPQVQKMKQLLDTVQEPKSFIMTVNAGAIPQDHWTQDWLVGGGRIIGEACHFIDLMCFLSGGDITSVQTQALHDPSGTLICEDKATITLSFSNGSFGSIHYLANGSNHFPKERIEVFTAGRILQLDNFRKLRGYSWPRFKKMNLWQQDKGQNACTAAFLNAIEAGKPSPIAPQEIFNVTRASIQAAELIRQ